VARSIQTERDGDLSIGFEDYASFDGTGLAALVRRGEVSAAELLDVALERLTAIEAMINPLAVRMFDVARTRAAEALSGPFAGVPFLLKDWHHEYEGQPDTGGSRSRRRWVSTAHSTITRRWLDAGLVIFGKTTTPEFALKAVTESALYGPTRNPLDPTRSPGGSSGGAAAAVAAGLVPMAGASDGGGSIRIPASYCGLFGFRPGRGVVPEGPHQAEGWEGANSNFVLTRSVRDAAAMLDVLAGSDAGAPFAARTEAGGYGEAIRSAPRPLRIGFVTSSGLGPVHPACVDAVQETGRLLQSLGHHVEMAAPDIDDAAVARCFLALYCGQVPADVAAARARTGARTSDFEIDTRALDKLGRAMRAPEYVAARRAWNGFGRALAAFFERFDLFMLPAVAQPPPLIGELDPTKGERMAMNALVLPGLPRLAGRLGALDKLARTALARTPFTQLSNLTGTPSMSVPLHRAPVDGTMLAFGTQFVAPVGGETRLLRLAAQLEAARPWPSGQRSGQATTVSAGASAT
jgi:amidase